MSMIKELVGIAREISRNVRGGCHLEALKSAGIYVPPGMFRNPPRNLEEAAARLELRIRADGPEVARNLAAPETRVSTLKTLVKGAPYFRRHYGDEVFIRVGLPDIPDMDHIFYLEGPDKTGEKAVVRGNVLGVKDFGGRRTGPDRAEISLTKLAKAIDPVVREDPQAVILYIEKGKGKK